MSGLMTAGQAGTAAPPSEPDDPALRLEAHRAELAAHCRRVLGSASEAEDAVQETLVRAWGSFDRFEGRCSLRSWLYRIATNVCVDMVRAPQRRARPIDPASWPTGGAGGGPVRPDAARIDAAGVGHPAPAVDDPAEQAVERDAVRLAFVTALRRLPPRQRSVLLLREVLRWRATEVAEVLGTTVPAVNSALQRARSTLAAGHGAGRGHGAGDRPSDRSQQPMDDEQRALLRVYTDAFDRYDLDSLVSLLR